jgi:hypothetical protein
MKQIHITLIHLILLLISPSPSSAADDETSEVLKDMFGQMESYTLQWARHMESLLLPENKCSSQTLSRCSEGSFNGCISEMPYAECPGAEHRILRCGDGNEGGCSGIFDFTATRVSLAKSDDISKTIKNPSLREKDGVCYSLPGDDFIVETRASKNVTDYWGQYKVLPPW